MAEDQPATEFVLECLCLAPLLFFRVFEGFRLTHSHKAGMDSGIKSSEVAAEGFRV